MRIEAVDLFYLSMPEVLDIGDGSQDALLVRVSAGGHTGWGECEASPLTSIASFVCPLSHSACKPVRDAVLGQELESVADIARIGQRIRHSSADLLQTDHTLSGIDIALWDLLGRARNEPVYRLLGYRRAYPKLPYASQLFGDTPEETYTKARAVRAEGYRAAKFGWGPYGHGTPKRDRDQVRAAREGVGPNTLLMIDAGMAFDEDARTASKRLRDLKEVKAYWLEEPFVSGALKAYALLARSTPRVSLAGGEGCHNPHMAEHMIDYARLRFIQIDTGRIGGISAAKRVADYAVAKKVTYVNHTYTTPLALSASLQPYAGLKDHRICEYPVAPKALSVEIYREPMMRDEAGEIHVPEAPGLGITPDFDAMQKYLVPTEIMVRGKVLYRTPELR